MVRSTEDPAMVKTVETSSVSREFGGSGDMQRTEARCQGRDNVPVKLDKAHVTLDDSGHLKAGDSSHGKGGTQKFPTNMSILIGNGF